MPHEIILPKEYMDRCVAHGELMTSSYSAGLNNRSRSVSSHGADLDPKLQAHAKMGECAFAIWDGQDPHEVLNWRNRPDPGYDITATIGSLLDIKTITAGKNYLCWPINKNRLFDKKRFDALVLVIGNGPRFEIQGWINKIDFREKRQIASKLHVLDTGTWFVHKSQLWSMDDFTPVRSAK